MKRFLFSVMLCTPFFLCSQTDNRFEFYSFVKKQKEVITSIFAYLNRAHPDSVLFLTDAQYQMDETVSDRLKQASATLKELRDTSLIMLELRAYTDSYTEYRYSCYIGRNDYFRADIRMSMDKRHPVMLQFSYKDLKTLNEEKQRGTNLKAPPPPPMATMGAMTPAADKNTTDKKEVSGEEGKVFAFAERQPDFPGGEKELMQFLIRNIHYPEMEKDNDIKGTVVITFIVNKEGKVFDIRVLKGVRGGPGLSEETIRVILMMPNWTPGYMNGKPVLVQYNMPVTYNLK